MEFFTLVRPEHLNHYNYLFGGVMLQWIDEFAYIAAIREFPSGRFVTRAMDKVSFHKSVNNGTLLRFQVTRERLGNTSVSYRVRVWARNFQEISENEVFETVVTMVSMNSEGNKISLPKEFVID